MSYQLATLVWVLLIISVIVSAITTFILLSVAVETENFKTVGYGVGMLFLTAIVGWGIWVVYPMTSAGLGI